MRLVDDDGVVGAQERVGLRLGQQNAVGHQLDGSVLGEPVLEAHLEAHHITQRGFELFGNALGHRTGGNATRLRVADHLGARRWASVGQGQRVIQLAAPHGQGDLG